MEGRLKEDSRSAGATEVSKAVYRSDKVIEHNFQMLKDIPNLFHDTMIPESNVVFCIDTSGSMYHVLDTVKQHLLEAIMKHAAKENAPHFNIIEFNSSINVWCEKMVPCIDSSVKAAARWINVLTAKTGTNTRDALIAAFNFKDCDAVYMVSDGLPDSKIDELFTTLSRVSRDRAVHVTYVCEWQEDEKVSMVLRQIARRTAGHYRVVAFGLNGPLLRASLIVNEPSPRHRQPKPVPIVVHRNAMCGVQIYEPGESMLSYEVKMSYPSENNSGNSQRNAFEFKRQSNRSNTEHSKASTSQSTNGTLKSRPHFVQSPDKASITPFSLPVYPTVAECHCHEEKLQSHARPTPEVRKQVRICADRELSDDELYLASGRQSRVSANSRLSNSENYDFDPVSRSRSVKFHRQSSFDAPQGGHSTAGKHRRESQCRHQRGKQSGDVDGERFNAKSRDRRRRRHQDSAKSASWYEQAARAYGNSHVTSRDEQQLSRSPSSSSCSSSSDAESYPESRRRDRRRRSQRSERYQDDSCCSDCGRSLDLEDAVETRRSTPRPRSAAFTRSARPKAQTSDFAPYRDTLQPVNSIEFHRVRTARTQRPPSSEKSDQQPERLNRRQRGHLEREQQVLQRRLQEALRLEKQRESKLGAKLEQSQREALRELKASRTRKGLEAAREENARERAAHLSERALHGDALLRQHEALRTQLAAERLAALQSQEQHAEQRAERVRDYKRQQYAEQQLRIARIANMEAARLPSELSRTHTEAVLCLRK